jgi:alanine dehydrogenase
MDHKTKIGIRREDINRWERRVPLIPSHARELVDNHPLEIVVQSSDIRVFADGDFRMAGIPVVDSLSPCSIVLAIKEIPIERLEKDKTYVFFSHTAKGQKQNMPMLKRMMELGCSLVDYEKMVDGQGRRVLFFGNYAGHAGMIDTLWALGRRLEVEGTPNPFSILHPAHDYRNLSEVREAVAELAVNIIDHGLPGGLGPLVVGFFGYGHVSQGAQEILDILPVEAVQPAELPGLFRGPDGETRLYKTVFKEEDMVRPVDPGRAFDLQEYYDEPQLYKPVVEELLPYLTVLVNGIYWAPQYPKFLTRSFLKRLYGGEARPRLRVVADITCDVDGSIECNKKATDSADPVYVYDPARDEIRMGVEGRGPVVLAVYNLPAELPLESSTYFSGGLKTYVPAFAAADFRGRFEDCGLPDVIRRAVILYRGELTPDYAYLGPSLK